MGSCCCGKEKEKDDIPNITIKDLCNDIHFNCASSCCIKQKPKHHHHRHHIKDDNK